MGSTMAAASLCEQSVLLINPWGGYTGGVGDRDTCLKIRAMSRQNVQFIDDKFMYTIALYMVMMVHLHIKLCSFYIA